MQPRPFALHLALSLLCGCASSLPKAPQTTESDPLFETAISEELPGFLNSAPQSWQVLPGDVLRFRTISADPIEEPMIRVDGEGKVELPLLGAIPIKGLSLTQASARIDEQLRRFDPYGKSVLSVVDPAGHKVTIIGAVERPGVYPLAEGGRLADLLVLAGGPKMNHQEAESSSQADVESGRVVRAQQALPVNLRRALEGHPAHNVFMASGDLIYIPALQGAAIRVLGEVKTARTIGYRPQIRLSEVLARAGGTTKDADDGDVRIVRGPLSRPRVFRASVKALADGQVADVELARGDIVFVTKHWVATTGEVMQRLTPILAAAALGATLSK